MKNILRRRGATDHGYALIAFIGLMVLLTAVSTVFFANAQRANLASKNSRGFVESGQALDAAVQQAIFRLNSDPALSSTPADEFANYPSSKATAKTETVDNYDSRATKSTFTWWIDSRSSQPGDQIATLHVSGAAVTANRDVAIKLYAARVGSVSQGTNGAISYSVAPQSLWTHVVSGNSVALTVPSGVASSTAIQGAVGLLGSNATTSGSFTAADTTGNVVSPTDGIFRYGQSGQDTAVGSGYVRPTDVGTAFTADTDFASQQLAQCASASTPWVASEHAGRLYAGGNLGCYSSMNFDVPTTVVGSGVFSALVSGPISVSASVSTASTAQLDIVATGSTALGDVTIDASANREVDAFIYAPQRNCSTTGMVTGAVVTYKGAIECQSVKMTAQFVGVSNSAGGRPLIEDLRLQNDTGLNEVGAASYPTTIWYLGDYSQTSGQYN